MENVQAGLNNEAVKIIKRNKDMVYRLAFSQMKNSDDANDVFQEVFLRYIKHKPEFDSREHEKAWFIRVTLNCSKTSLRSFWKTRVSELEENIEYLEPEREDLSYALKKLPKKYNAVIHLFYYEDMSVKEMAEYLELSESNVRMLLTRARRRLKEIFEKEN